jgi:hypothetical protein
VFRVAEVVAGPQREKDRHEQDVGDQPHLQSPGVRTASTAIAVEKSAIPSTSQKVSSDGANTQPLSSAVR